MKYKIILLLLFAVFISACESKEEEYKGAIIIRDLPEIGSIAFNDSLYFEQCKAIKLEFSDKSLIGEISQLEISEKFIYVLDKRSVSLMLFDHTGKYIQSIGKKGSGPGEYLAINTFYLNNYNNTINLFDPLKLSVHRYDFNGNFIESVRFNDLFLCHIARATLLEDGTLFCFTDPNWHPEAGYFILNEKDYSLRKQIYTYPIPIEQQISYKVVDHPYIYYKKELHFVSLFSNLIQSYSDDQILPLYYIDNDKKEDIDYVKSTSKIYEDNYFAIIKKIANEDQSTAGLKNIFETERYICIDFYGKNLLSQAVLWDKKENTGYYINEYLGYTPHFGSIVYSFENTLVRVWTDFNIQLFKTNLKNGEITDKYPHDFLELLEQYEEDDNPILLFYTMRNK